MTSAAVVAGGARVWLGTVLDRRSDRVLASGTPSRSRAHLAHAALEVVEVVALAVLGATALDGP